MRFIVLTEDSGTTGTAAVIHVVERFLRELGVEAKESGCTVQATADRVAKSAINANAWKERTGDRARDLAAYIVDQIAAGSVVVVHFDADVPWMNGDPLRAQPSKNLEKWFSAVEPLITCGFRELEAPSPGEANGSTRTAPILLVPFYSMESWLLLNADVLKNCIGATRAEALRALAKNGHFDEVCQPKDEIPGKDKHNVALAQSLSLKKLRASPSFRACVEEARKDQSLKNLITALPRRF